MGLLRGFIRGIIDILNLVRDSTNIISHFLEFKWLYIIGLSDSEGIYNTLKNLGSCYGVVDYASTNNRPYILMIDLYLHIVFYTYFFSHII